jgi:hypothetical protein
VLPVFSSFTKRWEEKAFSRVGEAAGTVLELGIADIGNDSTAVYWHGALYVQCQKGFVLRYTYLFSEPHPLSQFSFIY